MRKFLSILWISCLCFSCATHHCKVHKKKAQQFIEEFYLSESEYNWQNVFNYTTTLHPKDFSMLKEKYRDSPKKAIEDFIEMYREAFSETKEYSLVCDKDINFDKYRDSDNPNELSTAAKKLKKMDRRDNTNIIFVTCNEGFLTFFIFDKHNNLISFFPDIFSTHYGDRVYPIYLEKETLELINNMEK